MSQLYQPDASLFRLIPTHLETSPPNLRSMKYLLSLDQGTTSTRSVLYDLSAKPIAESRKEFRQYFPQSGWVEHDASGIWETAKLTLSEVLAKASVSPTQVLGIGITNQRETAVLWDRETGLPVAPAIVWQDRRTAGDLQKLKASGKEEEVMEKTGLLLDPYFSASKISWMLENTPGLRERANKGELAAGTIDSWLAFKLSGGKVHVTDPSNASRTMLMNLHSGEWDDSLLGLFDIPKQLLPEIIPSSGVFGTTTVDIAGAEIPLAALIGDQQSALFGQHCFLPGMAKCTYGTGCFLLMHTGNQPVVSRNRLLSTVAWRIGSRPTEFALEGGVFVGGAAIQWLRDGMGMIQTASEVNALAARVPDSGGVVVVPAFTGLGAPYWDPTARGAVFGISRGTNASHIARATLEGISFQVADLIHAMEADSHCALPSLRVDGGASASDLLLQIQSDQLGIPVERPGNLETTALGATLLAGLATGVWNSPDDLQAVHEPLTRFSPTLPESDRTRLQKIWDKAVRRAQNWEEV